MTDRPYTDADLRAEAASCLASLGILPTVADIRRSLPDTYIDSHFTPDSGADATWSAVVGEDGLDVPVREIHALIQGAANTAEWAVDLGADGLEPTAHVINLDNADGPFVRLHLAIHPDMPEVDRLRLHAGLTHAIADAIDGPVDEVDELGDSDGDVLDLISEISSHLQDATDSGEYHAVCLIHELANGRTTVGEARTELADIEFGHV